MEKINQENGAFSIEAVIGITFFMLAIIAIMFISMIVKIQSTMQYALSQTAKEISGYYYLLDKTGLTKLTSGVTDDAAVEKINNAVTHVIEFSGGFEDTKTEAEDLIRKINDKSIDLAGIENSGESIKENATKLKSQADTLKADLELLKDDPAGQLKGIFSVFAKTMANKGLSYYIAPYVCKAIMPRYLAGDKEKSDKMLETMGIQRTINGVETSGIDSLDFSQTELLADGRSIKLVVIYKVNPEKMTFGFVKLPEEQWLIFRQTACTAAWIAPDGKNTLSLADAEKQVKENEKDESKDEDGG